MKIEKILWIVLISIPTHNEPVSAQSYSHEFVNPDGSSVMCSTRTNGYTGKTACANIPLKERLKHYQNQYNMLIKSRYCIELTKVPSDAPASTIMSSPVYGFQAYETCMSRPYGQQGSIADYNQSIAINPKNADAYYNRGVDKSALGDKQGAIADYNQAIAINPQDADAYNNRGLDKYSLGDKQGAIADYNQAIAINPKYTKSYYNRGNAKSTLGDKQGAIADYNQAIAINPKYADAYINRGNDKYDLGDKQGAIADYNKVIAINPQDADAYNNRGFVKDDLGDKQGACRDYKKAVSLGSKSAAQRLQTKNGSWCLDMP
jgi:tetratricopeptide (TPR) repeat protein